MRQRRRGNGGGSGDSNLNCRCGFALVATRATARTSALVEVSEARESAIDRRRNRDNYTDALVGAWVFVGP